MCVHMCLYAVPTIAVVYCFVLYTQCLTVLEPCVSVVCAYMYIGVCVNALIEVNDHKFHNPWVQIWSLLIFPYSQTPVEGDLVLSITP